MYFIQDNIKKGDAEENRFHAFEQSSVHLLQSILSAIRNWNHPSAFKNHPVLEHAISKTMREYYEGEYDSPNFHERSASAREISFSVS
mmetsp:Transcript_38012/g.50070  ORF Transcript_38012/g.50070 Transcript_38012/m.50070 type:complete len:88 (-) Transcript_38012:92-355(-)